MNKTPAYLSASIHRPRVGTPAFHSWEPQTQRYWFSSWLPHTVWVGGNGSTRTVTAVNLQKSGMKSQGWQTWIPLPGQSWHVGLLLQTDGTPHLWCTQAGSRITKGLLVSMSPTTSQMWLKLCWKWDLKLDVPSKPSLFIKSCWVCLVPSLATWSNSPPEDDQLIAQLPPSVVIYQLIWQQRSLTYKLSSAEIQQLNTTWFQIRLGCSSQSHPFRSLCHCLHEHCICLVPWISIQAGTLSWYSAYRQKQPPEPVCQPEGSGK